MAKDYTCDILLLPDSDDRAPLAMRENYRAAHLALCRLWDRAKGRPDYVKTEWNELWEAIHTLGTDGPGRALSESEIRANVYPKRT